MNKNTRPPPRILYVAGPSTPGDGHYLRYLTEQGLHVTESSAESAATTALSFQPDIIVLDFDYDGEVVASLKALNETKDIPVIALAKLRAATD